MATHEGQQVDTLPVQVYGWDYTNNVPVKLSVSTDGVIEVA